MIHTYHRAVSQMYALFTLFRHRYPEQSTTTSNYVAQVHIISTTTRQQYSESLFHAVSIKDNDV